MCILALYRAEDSILPERYAAWLNMTEKPVLVLGAKRAYASSYAEAGGIEEQGHRMPPLLLFSSKRTGSQPDLPERERELARGGIAKLRAPTRRSGGLYEAQFKHLTGYEASPLPRASPCE
jgi:hypothetical protein